MAGQAALRAGAGLVTVAIPESVLPIIAGSMPELMTEPLQETAAGTIANQSVAGLMKDKTVVAIGPGLTTVAETSAFVRRVGSECRAHVVRIRVYGQEHDLGAGARRLQTLRRLDAVHDGHRDIEHDHVRRQPSGRVEQHLSIPDRADDIEVRLEMTDDGREEFRVVIGQQDARPADGQTVHETEATRAGDVNATGKSYRNGTED